MDNWQDFYNQLRPPGETTNAWHLGAGHRSQIGLFNDRMGVGPESWVLTFEDRYVDETLDMSKPNVSGCSKLTAGIGAGFIAQITPFLDESDPANNNARWIRFGYSLYVGLFRYEQRAGLVEFTARQ